MASTRTLTIKQERKLLMLVLLFFCAPSPARCKRARVLCNKTVVCYGL